MAGQPQRTQVIEARIQAKLQDATTVASALNNIADDLRGFADIVQFVAGWLSVAEATIFPDGSLSAEQLAIFCQITRGAAPQKWWPLRQEQLRAMNLLGVRGAASGAFCTMPSLSRPDFELFTLVLEKDEEPKALTRSYQGGQLFWGPFVQNLARIDAIESEATPFFAPCPDGRDLRDVALTLATNLNVRVVFLEGESGSGKTTLARWIHAQSVPPLAGELIEEKCDETENVDLFKSKLLGTQRGDFNDARDKPGWIEQADGGTLFLDNIHLLDRRSQYALNGLLEKRAAYLSVRHRIRRPVTCKFILASAQQLTAMVQQGFLGDLANRLKPGRVQIRSVRQYCDADLQRLLQLFWKVVWRREGISSDPPPLPAGLCAVTREFQISGNFRQLESAFEHVIRTLHGRTPRKVDPEAYVLKYRDFLQAWEGADPALGSVLATDQTEILPLRELNRRYARWALGKCGTKIATYRALRISHPNLDKLLKDGDLGEDE
jgi:DNA-binding NtrC family response regulator